jgi:molybdopterin/thiamine biosynthesis adenylyltransferase
MTLHSTKDERKNMHVPLFSRISELFDVGSIADAHVVTAGCGSGGSQVALQLAMAGVRHFSLFDADTLRVENVIRHACGRRFVGYQKVVALAELLHDRNPDVQVEVFHDDLLSAPDLVECVNQSTMVVIATDNEPTRFFLNQLCVEAQKPFVVGRVFTRGIGGEVFCYRPGQGGCLACLEKVLERSQFRTSVREIDLISEADRQKMYGLGIEELKDSPGLNVDISFITSFHARFALDVIARTLPDRPKYFLPIENNYLVWGNRPQPPFEKHFEIQRMNLHAQDNCMVCSRKLSAPVLGVTPAVAPAAREPISPLLMDQAQITLPAAALDAIFAECDRFEDEETGGRLVGSLVTSSDSIELEVRGLIDAGPKTRRTRVSLFQDGEHQESVFREVERQSPGIQHLGSWHTHHMNGLETLSHGDVETYLRTVNHPAYDADVFYALLVTKRNKSGDAQNRFCVKHFLFCRGHERLWELPASHVHIVTSALLSPQIASEIDHDAEPSMTSTEHAVHAAADIDAADGEAVAAGRNAIVESVCRGGLSVVDAATISWKVTVGPPRRRVSRIWRRLVRALQFVRDRLRRENRNRDAEVQNKL